MAASWFYHRADGQTHFIYTEASSGISIGSRPSPVLHAYLSHQVFLLMASIGLFYRQLIYQGQFALASEKNHLTLKIYKTSAFPMSQ